MGNWDGPASRLDGVIGQDWYASHIAIRLQEFFFDVAPWQRRLWDAGTVSALNELLDASRWRDEHVLSESSVRWLARELERVIGQDRGAGDRKLKTSVTNELKSCVPFDSRHWRRLEQLIALVQDGYLERWQASIEEERPPGAERVARAYASHLLDRGYSLQFLHAWISRRIADQRSLNELLNDALELEAAEDSEFEILIPFRLMPKPQNASVQGNWLKPNAVKGWIEARGGLRSQSEHARHQGGFSYVVRAKDPYAATRTASEVLTRLLARASYVPGYSKLQAVGIAWVHQRGRASGVSAFPLRQSHRGAYVRSLEREKKLHDVGVATTTLDDALELAASLNNNSSPGPAIASGWSALEALLFAPGDAQDTKEGRGVVACDRAAALVAASWPRSELTGLAHRHLPGAATGGPRSPNDSEPLLGEKARALDLQKGKSPTSAEVRELHGKLGDAATNRERCQIIIDAYRSGQRLLLSNASDVAAQERMLGLIEAPLATLREVEMQVRHAFRRMYRFRNIVVHGGAASSLGLEVTLRTAAPLTGAALDRIAHGQLVSGMRPLALAAKADVHLGLVEGACGPSLSGLLE